MAPRDHTAADFHERYAVLLDIGRIVSSTLVPAELYRTIYEQASRLLETTGFYISLYEEATDEATVVFYVDRGITGPAGATYRGSESRAIRDRAPVLENRFETDRAILVLGDQEREAVTRSVIAAPMIREGKVLGVICAQSYHPDVYDDDDLELLRAIADLAAVAVWNARVVRELERQRRESQQLATVGRELTASLELDEVLQRLAQSARDMAEAGGAGVWLTRAGGEAELAVVAGEVAVPVGTRVPVPAALRERLESAAEPIILDAARPEPELPGDLMAYLDSRSALGVPLVAEGRLVGAMTISHDPPRTYPPDLVRLLQRLAFHASVAVANARLHEQVRLLSLTDPLTGLANRRHLDMFLAKEFAAARRGRDLTVVLFDLDDFKLYNDRAGHQAGDDVLRRFAALLASQTRAMNLAARYGGDEFLCVLSDTDKEGGAIHAGRVIRDVRQDAGMENVGVSAGMASYDEAMRSPAELIRQADEELYRAKTHQDEDLRTSAS